MELRQLRYFRVVVREGSFSRAADALHMTQPPLSHAIGQLERELGVKLLERLPRGVRPTEAGRHLDEAAGRILTGIDTVVDELHAIDQGHAGVVSVAAVPPFMWDSMPKLLRRFVRAYPDVEINLVELPLPGVLDAVEQRRADVGFIVTLSPDQIAHRYHGELVMRPYRALDYVAVFPAEMAHLPDPIDLAELDGATWIIPRAAEQLVSVWAEYGVKPSRVRIVETQQTTVPLTAAGLGIALMPATFERLGITSVVTRRIRQPIPSLEVSVLWRPDRDESPVLRRFVDFALANPDDDEAD